MIVLRSKYFAGDKKFDNFPRRLRKKYLREEQEAIEDNRFDHEFLRDRCRRDLKNIEREFETTRIINRDSGLEVPEANYNPLFHKKEFYIPEDKKAELDYRKSELLKKFKRDYKKLDEKHEEGLSRLKKHLIAQDREMQIYQDKRRRNNEHLRALDALQDRARDLRELREKRLRNKRIAIGTAAGVLGLGTLGYGGYKLYQKRKKSEIRKDDNTKN